MQRPSPQKQLLARLLIIAALIAVAWFVWHRQQKVAESNTNNPTTQTSQGNSQSNPAQVPAYVLETLQYIRRNGHSPDDFVGGREFQNKEKHLPAKDSQNKRIRYSEWDVHPKVKGQNRGPERLVTGSDHSAYFSRDHYKTFLKID
jgi:guanyl-specific ribonuclease Sa